MNGDLLVNQGRWNTHANGAAGNGTIFLNAPDLPNTPGGNGVAQLGIGGTNLGLTVTLTNNIVLNPTGQGLASFEVNVSTPTQNELTLNGVISGTGGLQKGRVAGTNGILTLGGANTYTGDTTILFGTLRTKGGSAIPDDSAVVMGNPAAVNSANLEIIDSETIGGLSGGGASTGNVQIASGQTLRVQQSVDATYAGVISGAAATSLIRQRRTHAHRRQHLHRQYAHQRDHRRRRCYEPGRRREHDRPPAAAASSRPRAGRAPRAT
jgi:autotransporter-associated beta strand protein